MMLTEYAVHKGLLFRMISLKLLYHEQTNHVQYILHEILKLEQQPRHSWIQQFIRPWLAHNVSSCSPSVQFRQSKVLQRGRACKVDVSSCSLSFQIWLASSYSRCSWDSCSFNEALLDLSTSSCGDTKLLQRLLSTHDCSFIQGASLQQESRMSNCIFISHTYITRWRARIQCSCCLLALMSPPCPWSHLTGFGNAVSLFEAADYGLVSLSSSLPHPASNSFSDNATKHILDSIRCLRGHLWP